MTIVQLRAFLYSAQLGSFTAAAVALGITQPTVSELVRKLEEEHGLQLFVRSGRSLTLTAAGETLLPWARHAIEGVEAGTHALEEIRGLVGGTVSIGVMRNAAFYFLPDVIAEFANKYPNVDLRLVGQNSAEVADAVRKGYLEAGLVVLPIDAEGLLVTRLLRDEVLWVSPAEQARSGPISIHDIATSRLIVYDAHYGWKDPTRRQLLERAQEQGINLSPKIEVEYVESALELVSKGLGETLVSSAVTQSGNFPSNISTVPLVPPLYDTIAVVTREKSTLAPAAERVLEIAAQTISRLGRRNS